MRSYIYEGASNGSANIASPADRIARTHQPEKEILSLQDYRTRHNQYNTDVGARSLTAAAPVFMSISYRLRLAVEYLMLCDRPLLILQTPRPCVPLRP